MTSRSRLIEELQARHAAGEDVLDQALALERELDAARRDLAVSEARRVTVEVELRALELETALLEGYRCLVCDPDAGGDR